MNRIEIFFKSRLRTRRLAVLLAFLGSLLAHILTIEPDASYWDCPEYLVTALRLEVGHPPGNPLWTLTARIFSFFGGSDPRAMAVAVNVSSALFTSGATAILASVIFLLLNFIRFPRLSSHSLSPRLTRDLSPDISSGGHLSLAMTNILRGIVAWGGAMTFGWADSPWFSALEAEVYAFSLFLTALVVRLMIGWTFMPSGPRSRRHLLLIVYITGLSIGVHQLNLLVLPALGVIWIFRRRPQNTGWWRILTAFLAGCAAVGAILLGMMPGALKIAGMFELACVNAFHWPPHSGVILFWGVAMLIFWILPFCFRYSRLQLLAWIPALLLTGYSSYMLLLLRGAANPPMNEAAPADIFALQSYLGRDQYGSTPLFYGRTPKSTILRREKILPDGSADYSRNALKDGAPKYALTDSGYVVYDHVRIPVYAPELNMLFPRMTSDDPSDIKAYADWAGMTSETMNSVEISYALDSLDRPVGRLLADGSRLRETELRPTYLQQLRYMLGYQFGYMYFRYILWNYSGRQNDRFAVGEVENGNFVTGFPAVDDLMLGPGETMPREIGRENPGHNVYFMIPLLFGILGILMLQSAGRRGKRANLVITILFLMTGLAIVFYLNQSPREPRERDYSFLGSLWAYAIWIGAGMALLIQCALNARLRGKITPRLRCVMTTAAVVVSLATPAWMLYQNYDDHDRSGRHGVSDFAINLLESLEPDAILFTNGDNYTFPLWWAQEALGVRRDVTIVNTAYLGTPWYVAQLRGDSYEAPGLKMLMPLDTLRLGGFSYSRYSSSPEFPSREDSLLAVDALDALRRFYSESSSSRRLPALLRIYNPEAGDSIIIRSSAVASASSSMSLRQLATLDIISSNAASAKPRPVYWQPALSQSDYAGFRPMTTRTLQTRRLVYSDSPDSAVIKRLLDFDLRKAPATKSGRREISAPDGRKTLDPKLPYADDTYGEMITWQRQNLLRLGGRLLNHDRPADALRIARLIDSIFPPGYHEYQIYAELDSMIDEGADLARLYLESARRLVAPDRVATDPQYQKGLQLLRRERERYLEWQNYRRSLPPHLQGVMTPKNLRKTRRLPYLDSLLQNYNQIP